jgi:hypothetical protein
MHHYVEDGARGKKEQGAVEGVEEVKEVAEENGEACHQIYRSGIHDIICTLHAIQTVQGDCERAIGDVAMDECNRAVRNALLHVLFDDGNATSDFDAESVSFQICIERVGAFLHAIEYDDRAQMLHDLEALVP